MGVDVLLVGPLPTPGIAYVTRRLRADAGIVISASHNSYQDNGIKFFSRDGFKLGDDTEREIEQLTFTGRIDDIRPTASEVGKATRIEDAGGRYIEHLKRSFPNGMTLEGMKIVADCAHGAADKVGPNRLAGISAAKDCFYSGDIASAISDASRNVDGILDKSDLENYEPKYSEPVGTTYLGYGVHGHSTWTQGPVLQQALNILECFDLKSMGHNSVEYIHTVTEALKLALADREAFYGDPDFASVPVDGLLSKQFASERSKEIDPMKAYPGMPSYGNPWAYSGLHGEVSPQPSYDSGGPMDLQHESGTTHITVMDSHGNMACSTPSGGAFNKSVFFP